MSKQSASEKAIKRRPGRAAMVRAKRAASGMATVEDLAAELGVGRNQAYAMVQAKAVPTLRFGRRWLIPRAAIAKLVSGETCDKSKTPSPIRKTDRLKGAGRLFACSHHRQVKGTSFMDSQHNNGSQLKFKTQRDWAAYGRTLLEGIEGAQWRIGEWWNARNVDWGNGKELAAAAGIDYKSARNAGSVAAAFDPSRRRDKLSFKHHAEVKTLPRGEQESWLDRAIIGDGDGWSAGRLRSVIKQSRTTAPVTGVPVDAPPEPLSPAADPAVEAATNALRTDFARTKTRIADLTHEIIGLLAHRPAHLEAIATARRQL